MFIWWIVSVLVLVIVCPLLAFFQPVLYIVLLSFFFFFDIITGGSVEDSQAEPLVEHKEVNFFIGRVVYCFSNIFLYLGVGVGILLLSQAAKLFLL
jgi:hypothetical protein